MKVYRRIQKHGKSIGVSIPSDVCKQLDLHKGDTLSVDIESKKIIMERIPEPTKNEVSEPASDINLNRSNRGAGND